MRLMSKRLGYIPVIFATSLTIQNARTSIAKTLIKYTTRKKKFFLFKKKREIMVFDYTKHTKYKVNPLYSWANNS